MNPKDIPAFPVKAEPYSSDDEYGMSMRDYFAAKAMQGALACDVDDPLTVAIYAYKVADAMMKAREL
jgi:hypothetical protein